MKNGLKKKMIAFLLSALLVMNLVLIPNLDSFASNISAETDFSYVYDGYTYGFYVYDNIPSGYTFNSDVIEYVINTAYDGFKYQIGSNLLGIKINQLFSGYMSLTFSLIINAHIALNKTIADWFYGSNYVYSWRFEGTGIDPDYPGHELYGPAYGFHFEGCLFEDIDIVLDQNGNFYGSEYIGNYTFTNIEDDLDYISVHQINPSEDEIYLPSVSYMDFNDLPHAYFQGKDLYFFSQDQQGLHTYRITNFVHSLIGLKSFAFSIQSDHNSDHVVYKDGSVVPEASGSAGNYFYYNGVQYGQEVSTRYESLINANLPSFNFSSQDYSRFGQNYNILTSLQRGIYNGSVISGTCPSLFLDIQSYIPINNPEPYVPGDTVLPIDDLPSDPEDPITDSDPDPVPGIDYPEPEPIPVPVPSLPPIVSGNDDLWPDMNGFFDAENELDGFLGPLRDFEFGSFSNVTADFSAALVWVSTIMMTLFDGSDFNILFSILAVFFIACALLGIYKWWNS